jgi:hypothetical protein
METTNWIRRGAAAAIALMAMGALPNGAEAQAPPAAPAPAQAAQCQLTFEPAALTAGGAAQELKVTLALSDVAEMDPAQIRTLKAPEESGLTLTRVEGEGFLVTVDLSAAKAGEWEIGAFEAAAGDEAAEPICVGKIQVR